jgi:SAM-dependent methyltransferase
MIMRPDDLVEFSRRSYARPTSVAGWGDEGFVDGGLADEEKSLLQKASLCGGRILVLGLGGGREAIPLARMGFDVTGIDFVPQLVEKAVENARRRGVTIQGLVQDFSRLDLPRGSYDAAWLMSGNYSSIPSKARRLRVLGAIREALRPGGYFFCGFLFGREERFRQPWKFIRRAFALLTLGNTRYQEGDSLLGGIEFGHYFASDVEAGAEFEAGGFEVVAMSTPPGTARGAAVLKKVS